MITYKNSWLYETHHQADEYIEIINCKHNSSSKTCLIYLLYEWNYILLFSICDIINYYFLVYEYYILSEKKKSKKLIV